MKFWRNWSEKKWFPYTVASCSAVVLYMLLNNIDIFLGFIYSVWVIVKPLLYGLILAYLIDPVARFYQQKPFRRLKKQNVARGISVICAILTVVIVVGLLGAGIFPQLIESISNIVNTFSDFVKEVDADSASFYKTLPLGLGNVFENFSVSDTVLDTASDYLTDNIQNIANTSVTIGSGFANFVIAFVLAIYYMMDKDRLKQMAHRFFILIFKEKRYERLREYTERADKILLQYIRCNLLEALIVGVINAVFMLIGQIPYVLLISIVVGVTNIAPTFGPAVGAIIGAIMLVLVNPWYALAFLIFTVVLQTVDGYIIKPRLFGESLGVSPLLILIMIIVGGRVCGVIGILLAIPISAIAQFIWDDMWKQYKSRKANGHIDNSNKN